MPKIGVSWGENVFTIITAFHDCPFPLFFHLFLFFRYVSPGFAKTEAPPNVKPYYAYGARDVNWYNSQFPIVARHCPTVLIVGQF